jgi:ring-1,2-phenylacetyl-CoA epoxidase subunit PaaE
VSHSIISSVIEILYAVIASAAKQSIKPQRKCGLLRYARNDGGEALMSQAPRFHRLAVNDLRREAADAVSMTFTIPKELEDDYSFTPGQYLTLRTTMDGEEVRRSYSICSGPDDGELRIAVKKVDGGAFSNWAADELKAGDELDVMTPTGRFGIAHAPGETRTYVGFAAGSGITPILSIVKGVLAREPNSRFFLFYGNRSTSNMLFLEDLEELKDRFMQRLSLFHVISGEEQDIPILHGRLDGEKVRVLLRSLVPAASVDHVFICGPAGMSEDIEATCREIGIAEDRIHVERFVSEFGGKPRPKKIIEASAPPKAMASLIIDGKRREVPVAEEESILDAALRAGMDLPFACKGGMCSTCRAKLVEGDAQMEVNYSLEPWELKAGFILTCQARPCSDKVVVDYDHV